MVYQWRELSRKKLCGKYGRNLESVQFKFEDDTIHEFIIKKEGNPVCVVALTDDNQVILAKQFRPGPKKVLLELPGGGVESDETPKDAITRELLEETGYEGNVKFVTRVYGCGYSTLHRYVFVATNCKQISEQKLDKNEDVEVVLLSLEDFRKHLHTGNMTDTETAYLGLDYLNLL
jgi:ADP-ribose pyrophosphatase